LRRIRVIAATNRALTEGVEAGTFRADLYYRLNILSIVLPPLREREGDVMQLAVELLLQAARRETRLAASIRDAADAARVLADIAEPLRRYAWPSNVRELQNVIERLAVELADVDADGDARGEGNGAIARDALGTIAPELFAPLTRTKKSALTLRERSRHVEADEIHAALAACDGDRDAVCKALGISKTTLWRKLNAVAR
jgi:transcriptional regulator, propionate catabolism operon regulatory protein